MNGQEFSEEVEELYDLIVNEDLSFKEKIMTAKINRKISQINRKISQKEYYARPEVKARRKEIYEKKKKETKQ